MATPASGAPPTPVTPRWSALRTGEPGSAFRGLSSRGGGRGGSRAGVRGGRGGGGGRGAIPQSSRGGKPPTDSTEKPPENTEKPAPKPEAATPKPKPEPLKTGTVTPQPIVAKLVTDKAPPTPSSTERPPRPKAASRRPSRNPVPAVVVDPVSPIPASAPPAVNTTFVRPPNRRKRSNQHGKGTANNTAKPSVSAQTSQASLRPQKIRTPGPPSPITPVKDAPPHLAIAHKEEIRHDIDALVERVRAVAMAEHRPTTPGSHIDWAGDEDDSLPDLDDWGVTTSVSKKPEISPILVDALKPLPEPRAMDELTPVKRINKSTPPARVDVPAPLPSSPPSSLPSSSQPPLEDGTSDMVPTPKNKRSGSSSSTGAGRTVPAAMSTNSAAPPSRLPLHPSLPPKPVCAVDTLRPRPKPRLGLSNVRHNPIHLPPKPVHAPVTVEEPIVSSTDGLPYSIHVPPLSAGLPQKEQDNEKEKAIEKAEVKEEVKEKEKETSPQRPEAEEGLSASMHAPKGPANASPHPPRVFNPSHNRSRTVGRPPSFQQSFTAPASVQRPTRSGASSPLGPQATHARTRSSPPSSGPANRPRPVITGDAISKLARTIGGSGLGTPRSVSVPTGAKD